MLIPSGRSRTRPYSLAIVAALLAVGLLPLDGTLRFLLATAMAWGVAAIGLDLFSGYLGQPSFGHAAFMGLGAYGVVILRTKADEAYPEAVAATLVGVAVVAAVIGAALVQLRSFGLILGTFFLSYVVTALIAGTTFADLTGAASGLRMPTLAVGAIRLSDGVGYYYLCAAVLLLAVVLTSNYADSRSGRALRLVKRSEVVATTLGVPNQLVKLAAFIYSAVLAGVGGILVATGTGYIAPESFAVEQSIILFAMVAVGGMGSIAGPILGAIMFTVLPSYLQAAKTLQELLFATLLMAALVRFRDGLYGLLESVVRRVRRNGMAGRQQSTVDLAPSAIKPATLAAPADLPVLEVADVRVEYGGVQALDGVSFTLHPGEVHALIGPNGAGKTTMLNCISGLERVSGGYVRVAAQPVLRGGRSEARVLGLSRTFQNPSLVPDLSIVENVMVGLFHEESGGLATDILGLGRRRDRAVARRAEQALAQVGLVPGRARVMARDLSLAEAKLVDIARAIVARGRLLVMDEPTAGLSDAEMTAVSHVIESLRADSTLAVLVVSHHVSWIQRVADGVTVLAAGRIIAAGPPAAVTADTRVREAFLGAPAAPETQARAR